MSPMDEYSWFDSPVVTVTSYVAGAKLQHIATNVRRVAVMFSSSSIAAGAIALLVPWSISFAATNGGLGISNSIAPMALNYRDHGNIVQGPWFVQNPSSGSITITSVEVLLKDWPADQQPTLEQYQRLAELLGLRPPQRS